MEIYFLLIIYYFTKKVYTFYTTHFYVMPRRSFKGRTFRRRSRKGYGKARRASRVRSARYRRPRATQTRLLRGPINRTCVAKLKYCETVTFTPGAGFLYGYEFRANDLFDPNKTGTGHQPMGFDQLMVNYQHFTVIGSKISANIHGPAGKICLMGVELASASGNATNNGEELRERQMVRWGIRYPPDSTAFAHGSFKKGFSAKKFFHVKALIGESQYKGDSGNSPSEQAFYVVYGGSHDGSSATGTFTANVTITYTAVFSEPKTVGQS